MNPVWNVIGYAYWYTNTSCVIALSLPTVICNINEMVLGQTPRNNTEIFMKTLVENYLKSFSTVFFNFALTVKEKSKLIHDR